ncbi:1003_t:CDS:2 [Paraglomus brasilianum]|uniref:1003_t:CDS:1 n=1 Tax=Paraglomus brasilianum TaxID=144538 RepID=A0A9N8YUI1_9GLOM|nr:1003_t:CDS:2 [Paraglomus brasilianum]
MSTKTNTYPPPYDATVLQIPSMAATSSPGSTVYIQDPRTGHLTPAFIPSGNEHAYTNTSGNYTTGNDSFQYVPAGNQTRIPNPAYVRPDSTITASPPNVIGDYVGGFNLVYSVAYSLSAVVLDSSCVGACECQTMLCL